MNNNISGDQQVTLLAWAGRVYLILNEQVEHVLPYLPHQLVLNGKVHGGRLHFGLLGLRWLIHLLVL